MHSANTTALIISRPNCAWDCLKKKKKKKKTKKKNAKIELIQFCAKVMKFLSYWQSNNTLLSSFNEYLCLATYALIILYSHIIYRYMNTSSGCGHGCASQFRNKIRWRKHYYILLQFHKLQKWNKCYCCAVCPVDGSTVHGNRCSHLVSTPVIYMMQADIIYKYTMHDALQILQYSTIYACAMCCIEWEHRHLSIAYEYYAIRLPSFLYLVYICCIRVI